MSKVLMIGIDGLDSIQLSKFEDYLPNFGELKESSPKVNLVSVFPPDSVPAWGSIYTGLNPAEHGVVNFLDPIGKNKKIIFKEIHKYYRGKTFWDVASKHGKRVCILLPYSIYPPWPVNGVMVCRSLDIVDENFPLKTYPEEIYDEFKLFDFKVNLFHGIPPKRKLDKYVNTLRRRTVDEAELGLRFLRNYDADLYFIYFSALDAVQHTFWSYCDENHPDYPGKNKYQTVIRDFYILFDKIIGKYLDLVDDSTTVIILSDHGHGMRPVNLVNINEILRRKGYLQTKEKVMKSFETKKWLKKLLSKFVTTFGIGNMTLKLLDKFPILKEVVVTPNYIDWNKTIAYVSVISGVKSYSEGGIIINKDIINSSEKYEKKRNLIIKELSEIKDPKTGKKLIRWICKREDLYQGKYIDRYPDIVFELKEGFGVGLGVHGHSVSNFQPGSHKRYSSTFLIYGLDNKLKYNKNYMTLMDVKPIVLSLLNIG